MDQPPTTLRSIKSFMDEMIMKKNELPAISGKPTFTSCKPLMDVINKNLINMDNECNPIYGKLHTVSNTSQPPGGPALQVVPSTNQGRLTPYVAPTTTQERHNYITRHYENQLYWLEDMNAEEACNKLIILVINAVYLEPLWEPRFETKEKPSATSWIYSSMNFNRHLKNEQQ